MQINICHSQISLIMTYPSLGANATCKGFVGFGNLFSGVLGSRMNEKLCAWQITYLLREEQGTYELTFGHSCGAWSRKIYMKTILCEATKGTKSVEMSQGWAMPMIWAYCFPLSSSYVNYFFCELIYSTESSTWKWKHMHESHDDKCPKAGHNLFKLYLQKIKHSILLIRAGFLLTCSFSLGSVKQDGGKIEPPSRPHVGTEKWRLTRQNWKHPNVGRSQHRGNTRAGISQMARKGKRAGCQKLKSNLSLLEPYIIQHCQ